MLSCDQLKFCMQHLCPDLEFGRDYWTGHPVDNARNQTGEAYFMTWNVKDREPPTQAEIYAIWPSLQHEFNISAQDFLARYRRKDLLEEADHMVNRAMDKGKPDAEAQARAYRQALRDIPQQPGYPLKINWPTKPSGV